MKKILLISAVAALCACQEKTEATSAVLADPSGLKVEQQDLTSARFSWVDNAQGEKGYRVFLRKEGDSYMIEPKATLEADATSYVFEDLTVGAVYDFGVQAVAEDVQNHSKTVYLNDYEMLDREDLASQEGYARVAAPSGLSVVQNGDVSVTLSWTDNAQDETGYAIYVRKSSENKFGEPAATLPANVETYDVGGLKGGVSYVFGVQATGASIVNDSKVETVEFVLKDNSKIPAVIKVKTSYAYIAVSYKVQTLSGTPDHGVCFSLSGAPTVDDIKVPGPEISANKEIVQVVSAAHLEVGKEYQMSAYIKDGDTYNYSEPQTVSLDAQPELPQLSWEKQSYEGAEGVEVYKTTSQLNGRNFNAWYAIADPAKVDFRVLYPETVGTKKTVAAQAEAAGDCLALINGAIYGNYNIGVIITEGKMTQQWHGEIEGCYWATNSQLYQLTRPIIGVDKDGKAGAYWVGVPQQGTFYYYDRPQANVVGQAKYPKVTATSPAPAVEWNPYFAISCGPMVLYDGKVCADNTMIDDTHYYTNFECWDESGVYSAHPDRSAVGVTADGKIVLFICDGRIDASQGAYIKELGPIMKSLGCVHAMNLDGGGSTGMWINGAGMINYKDSSWRAVKSTLGFFKK